MHPDQVGYQLLPNNRDNSENKYKNNDIDQIHLGSDGSPTREASQEKFKVNHYSPPKNMTIDQPVAGTGNIGSLRHGNSSHLTYTN